METIKGTWQTKLVCPDCEQGNTTFYYRDKYGFKTLMCEETGDTFINPRSLEE